MNFILVCKKCGSDEVLREKFVNVNTNKVYEDPETASTLEWCVNCNEETTIVEKGYDDKSTKDYDNLMEGLR